LLIRGQNTPFIGKKQLGLRDVFPHIMNVVAEPAFSHANERWILVLQVSEFSPLDRILNVSRELAES
jgi:hypothetical protein